MNVTAAQDYEFRELTRESRDDEPLTEAQEKVLNFVEVFIGNNGFPPTRREISRGLNWNSGNAAEDCLRILERKGRVRLVRGISRGIVLR